MIRILLLFLLFMLLPPPGWSDSLTPLRESITAPPLLLPDLAGGLHDIHAYRGRVVLINFWASWCAPCIREMLALERIGKALEGHGGKVLAVNQGERPKQVQRFLRRKPVDLTILLDTDSAASLDWGVQSLPTSLVMDAAGSVVARVLGAYPWDDPALLDQIAGYRSFDPVPYRPKPAEPVRTEPLQ